MSAIALDIPRSRKWTWAQVIGALIAALSMLILSGGGGSVDEGGGDPPAASSACDGQTITDYIRDGGTGDGDAWDDALDAVPASLVRGGFYRIADGSYGSYTLDDAVSGTDVITLCKATGSYHGTETGWSSTYGDGQAVFGDFNVATDYVTLDGVTSTYGDDGSYGFRMTTIGACGNAIAGCGFGGGTVGVTGHCARHVKLFHAELGGAYSASHTGSEPENTVYLAGFGNDCSDWHLAYTFHHNIEVSTFIQLAGVTNVGGSYGLLIEHSLLQYGWGKEAIRGGNDDAEDIIVRWNEFDDACGQSGGPGEGCTAEIGVWGSAHDNWKVYGNTFRLTRDENSGGTIIIGGDGAGWPGPSATGVEVYNNTIVGYSGGNQAGFILVNGTGTCQNNLWYDTNVASASCSTSNNNTDAGADPFVNYAGGDLHLAAATSAGQTLSSPYDVDMDGVTRGADGTWDRGAFEYVAP